MVKMIIVLCNAEVAPEKQAAFVEAVKASGAIEGTLKEAGNISYDLVCSATQPGKMLMVERWEDMAALQAHSKGANLMAIGKISAEYGVKNEIKLFKADALN